MDSSPPGSSVHGVFQVRILEWVAISFSRGSSKSKDWKYISHTASRFFTSQPWEKPYAYKKCTLKVIQILPNQSSSVAQSGTTLCDPRNRSTPGFPVHHQLPESTQTHGHWVGDAIQPCHPLLSPSPPTLNLSQHQGLFKWVSSSHQVSKLLEFQLQYQSFQWTTGTDLL